MMLSLSCLLRKDHAQQHKANYMMTWLSSNSHNSKNINIKNINIRNISIKNTDINKTVQYCMNLYIA